MSYKWSKHFTCFLHRHFTEGLFAEVERPDGDPIHGREKQTEASFTLLMLLWGAVGWTTGGHYSPQHEKWQLHCCTDIAIGHSKGKKKTGKEGQVHLPTIPGVTMPSMSQLLGSKRFSFLTGSDSTSSSHLLAATREYWRVQVSLLIMTDVFFFLYK